MMRKMLRLALQTLLLLALCRASLAQVAPGRPPLSSAMGGSVDTIDLANLNAHITIPVLQKAGRGIPFNYLIEYDSSIWQPVVSSGSEAWQPTNAGSVGWSFMALGAAVETYYGALSYCYTYVMGYGYVETGVEIQIWYAYTDVLDTVHGFPGTVVEYGGSCGSGFAGSPGTAIDGSGYSMTINGSTGSATVTARNGANVYFTDSGNTYGVPIATDANGNQITLNTSGQFFDTLSSSTPTLTVTGTAPSNTTFTYVAPSGANASYTMKYTQYSIETNFGCTGVTEYGANGTTTQYLVSEIDLPDIGVNSSDKYTFTYEATPGHSGYVTGRLASVKLPTGGTITYSYSGGTGSGNSGIVCADGSTATLTRQTPDGTWTYAHSESGTQWTTNVTDPLSNNSVLNFQTIYLTGRQVYQGSVSPSNLLKTTLNCYNTSTPSGSPATCNAAAITLPITKKTTYTIWPGTNALQSEVVMSYNGTSGLGTETDEYAYGPGAPGALVRKTVTSYAGLSNGIQNASSSVVVYDGSSNVVAETVNSYDQGTTTATSAPQHITFSGSHGNLTTALSYVTGSSYLTKTFTYYDTGTVKTATDYNGAQTSYTYGTCGNAFPTSIAEPIGSMTQTMTWNCTGGVETSSTDENGQTTYYDYATNAYFWLPDYTKDPAGYQTNFSYTGLSSIESSMLFNSNNSTVDILSTADSLGRPYLSQVREGPSSSTYDTTETDYNSDAMAYKVSLPFASTAGTGNSSAKYQKSETFDALGRPTQITDNGSPNHLTVTLTYNQNDAYRSRGPAPSGENTKQRQYEYDALGRMTSVCEITSMTGSGSCGQTVSKTGYWTKYTYDPNNNLTGVTQNAQASSGSQQARVYTYDMLGRMTSECNPETGNITSIIACPTGSRTTYYYYDSDSTCGTSKGDLVKKVDPAGNVTCYAYDAMHRGTSIIVNSGPMSSSTPKRYFVYDSATINGTWTMAYAKSRQAEAYTCTSSCTTKLTDIGFSYTVRGEITNQYEEMPNSGGYYNISQTYWANETPDVMSGLSGLPTITYTPDGEGRINSTAASSGQSPLLSSTSYDVSSRPTAVNFGSLDSDAFTYDPNTERMTKYQLNVNGQSVVGQLAWNAIGTLQQLAITDPFNSANNQTCSYVYDDLNRVQSVSCGTTWSQTFSYDAFGNIAKSGSSSFGAIYTTNPPTNQYSSIGGSGASYDNNGDVTNDYSHTYAWDANGNPVTIDTVSVTYDALGRMVEQNRSGSYTEIVYGPSGAKLGLMTGLSTLQKGYVPLTGGTMAVYNASGLAYYRHSDWEGTSRFASTPSRTKYFDGAYAPFGESYATSGTTDLSYTGQQQDTVSNLYDFPARRYGPGPGRWSSPDPSGTSSASAMNPQSWNRYAYVFNNPLGFVDDSGAYAVGIGESTGPNLCFAASQPSRKSWCPGTTDCSYYQKVCATRTNPWGKFYYCNLAPTVCKAAPNGPWDNCVRACLQSHDPCQNIDSQETMWECDGQVHAFCFAFCTVCGYVNGH